MGFDLVVNFRRMLQSDVNVDWWSVQWTSIADRFLVAVSAGCHLEACSDCILICSGVTLQVETCLLVSKNCAMERKFVNFRLRRRNAQMRVTNRQTKENAKCCDMCLLFSEATVAQTVTAQRWRCRQGMCSNPAGSNFFSLSIKSSFNQQSKTQFLSRVLQQLPMGWLKLVTVYKCRHLPSQVSAELIRHTLVMRWGGL